MFRGIQLIKLIFIAVLTTQCRAYTDRYYELRKIPSGFLFGVATSSYQIEGAWNVEGKSENMFDRLYHTEQFKMKCYTKDCSNGDIATNSYFLYKRDVEMLREVGVDFYRFSLSWSRILPTGFPNKINLEGVQYYNNLINELLKYNIQPVVTLFHWDLPQALQDLGGLSNPNFIDWIGDYSKVAYELFGDRVKYWITVNEPHQICEFGYGNDILAPAINSKGIGVYLCSKNLLLGHAKAYHIYDELYRPIYGGSVFIAINCHWFEPSTNKESDIEAANDIYQFFFNMYAHPIFSKNGDYPTLTKLRIAKKSFEQGFYRSRLPELTQEEIKYIRGTSDMLGLSHYSTYYVYRNESSFSKTNNPSYDDDQGVSTYQPNEWKIGESDIFKFVPWGFYKILMRLKMEYNNPKIFITENGFSTHGGLYDDDRVLYLKEYLSAMLDAIDDGVQVIAYTFWSIMDNFEWSQGYTERLGLYEVDFNRTLRIRRPRKSAYVYKEIIRSRSLDRFYEPDLSLPITIDAGH